MHSMTGCGRSQMSDGAIEITIELKSVNHRFLDINCRLPHQLSFLEESIRREIGKSLHRGHVEVYFSLRALSSQDSGVTVNTMLADCYLDASKQIAVSTGLPNDLSVYQLMQLPGVVTVSDVTPDEESSSLLCARTTAEAVEKVLQMRIREGEALRSDLTYHLDLADTLREKIAARAPLVVEEYRARLNQRLAQLGVDCDPARFAQEVALMADRCAIDEELSRLQSHIAQMRLYMNAEGDIGKKMDFLIQEMNREANTIGSKCSDADIAQTVVNLKSEIEKLREQIQNVE